MPVSRPASHPLLPPPSLLARVGHYAPLLVFLALLLASALGASPLIIFSLAALAIIGLASYMGRATEVLAGHLGSTMGGFLNATFGNAAEFIIAIIAINAGLIDLVKASLTGSIVGNILFVMGASLVVGGLKFKEQRFDVRQAGLNSTMLLIAVASMLIPSTFYFFSTSAAGHDLGLQTEELSLFVSLLLIGLYLLSLLFSFHTHSYLFRKRAHEPPTMSARNAVLWLLLSTAALAISSEIFTHHLQEVSHELGFTALFTGAVIVALIGNSAEHLAAIHAAQRNDLDLAFSIAVGSSIQIALFVAPMLVLLSFALGRPMNLVFTLFEILAVFASVLIINEISSDGECNWFEGAQLVVMYLIVAGLFFFVS